MANKCLADRSQNSLDFDGGIGGLIVMFAAFWVSSSPLSPSFARDKDGRLSIISEPREPFDRKRTTYSAGCTKPLLRVVRTHLVFGRWSMPVWI